MNDGAVLESLLDSASRAEGKRDAQSLNELALQARDAGVEALALRSAVLARQRGYGEAPSTAELELLFRYEQVEALIDLAIEFHLEDVLQRVVLTFGGHPDLHPQGTAAADALASMTGAAPALPKRRVEPEIEDLWEALLAGDASLFGWGIRRFGAPFVDRVMRLAAQGIESLVKVAGLSPIWVEIQAGKSAALPYYQFAAEQGLGAHEAHRMSLILCAALHARELALDACDGEPERIALATWVLGRPSEEAIDARWLRFLDEAALAAFAEAEGKRWLAGEPPRLQVERICGEPRLAGAFQPWFMAMGDFPAVLACIESRCRIAERGERVQLERAAAEMLEHLGQAETALSHAVEALLLAPDQGEAFELVYALGRAHPGQRRRACDHLLAAAETTARADRGLRALSLLVGDEDRLRSGLELLLNSFDGSRILEAYDRLDEVHADLGHILYSVLSERDGLDADRVVGFVRSQLPVLTAQGEEADYEPLLQLLERHALEDERSGRLRIPILLEMGRGSEALEALDAAGVPDRGSWALLRARAHWLCGEKEKAKTLLETAVVSGSRAAEDLLRSMQSGD